MNKSKNKLTNFPNIEKLSDKQIQKIIELLEQYYLCSCSLLKKYSFYLMGDRKIYIYSGKEIIDINKRINSIGLYFISIHKNFRLRLSTEGVNFIKQKMNYVVLNEKSFMTFINGENLFIEEVKKIVSNDKSPFLIVKYKNQNLGCVSKKDNLLISYIPKSRKLDYNKLF